MPRRPSFGERQFAEPDHWTTAGRERLAVVHMATDHLWGVLYYCRRNLEHIRAGHPVAPELPATTYLYTRPVIVTIMDELVARGEASDRAAIVAIVEDNPRAS